MSKIDSNSSENPISREDWLLLAQMRKAYLGEKAETQWSSARSFELYDKFFGERIADKWISALAMAGERGAQQRFSDWASAPSERPVQIWDWGCGTGRASRTFLRRWMKEPASPLQVVLSDRSPQIEEWAKTALQSECGEVTRIKSAEVKTERLVLLVSHVLNELSSSQAGALADVAARAAWVFWIENGSKATSRQLGLVRNKLRHTHDVLAPCVGQGTCPATNNSDHSHWCHFFAERTGEYFSDPLWAEFSKQMGVDLRSLPFSFVIAQRKSEARPLRLTENPTRGVHLGRARVYKGYAEALVCDTNTELQDWRYPKKDYGELYRAFKKESSPAVLEAPKK